jgi:hypothetical protein
LGGDDTATTPPALHLVRFLDIFLLFVLFLFVLFLFVGICLLDFRYCW